MNHLNCRRPELDWNKPTIFEFSFSFTLKAVAIFKNVSISSRYLKISKRLNSVILHRKVRNDSVKCDRSLNKEVYMYKIWKIPYLSTEPTLHIFLVLTILRIGSCGSSSTNSALDNRSNVSETPVTSPTGNVPFSPVFSYLPLNEFRTKS